MTIKTECETVVARTYCPEDIVSKFSGPIVEVQCIPKFRTFWQAYIKAIEEVNGATFYNAGILPVSSTGFFTVNGGIASSSVFNTILLVSAMVMTFSSPFCWEPGTNDFHASIKAFLTQNNNPSPTTPYINRYPDLPGFSDVLRDLCSGGFFSDWFEFLIDVPVQGYGRCPTTYRAYLSGMDFDTGFALFKIKSTDPWNDCLPRVNRMPTLKFGDSRESRTGSTVYTIFNSRTTGPNAFRAGVVSANSALVRDGSVTYEVITTDLSVEEGAEGAPLLNSCGQVIGMITGVTENGKAFGVTSNYLKPIFEALDSASRNPNCTDYAVFIASFGCNVYRRARLELTYYTKTGATINQAFLRVAMGDGGCGSSCNECTIYGSCPLNQPSEYWRDRFYTYQNCRINREQVGVVLADPPCGALADAAEECSINDPNYGETRNRSYRLEQGDIITHLNGIAIGGLEGQEGIDTILNGLPPCTCIEITFYKENELFTQPHMINVRTDDNLAWVSGFMPCCRPCLSYDCDAVLRRCEPSGQPSGEPSGAVDFGSLVNNVLELSKAINSWIGLIRWFSYTVPQVYRATLFTNFELLMTRMNEWISVLASPHPMGASGLVCPNNMSAHNQALLPTPLSAALTLTQLSRAMVTTVAAPSIATSVRPIPFYNFIGSFAHPNSACAFEKTIPNYLSLIGSKYVQYRAATDPVSCDTSHTVSGEDYHFM